MRMLGSLQDRMDSLLDQVNDHEARIVKQENKTKTHDGMHKNGKCLSSLFFSSYTFICLK